MINDLWYKNAVIYCLSVGTYMDSNADGIGDFKGLMRRLDYLHGLGVTAIWLMPFQVSPHRDDGYDVSDYYGVDPRYNSIPLAAAPNVDATVAYVAMRSPVSNTFARYENAERRRNESMVKNNKVFFNPWDTIHESNPQEILEREEKVTLVPFLIMQGALDDNVLPEMQEKFAKTYRAAGGYCDYRLFENSVHEWVAEPGPQTDKAVEVVKEFIARQLKA